MGARRNSMGGGTSEEIDLPPHPLGVKPSGNVYTATHEVRSPFSILPDELLVHILEDLDPVSLALVGASCKHLRAFSRFDELWKTHCVLSPPQPLVWQGSWFATFTGKELASVSCDGVFSDTLYRPFLCAHTPLEPYATDIPKRNEIRRLPNLSVNEFSESWTNTPFILTEPVADWHVYQTWTEAGLRRDFGDTVFRAECVDWPLATYLDYMNNTHDESPLYLFDRAFVEKMSLNVADGQHTSNDEQDGQGDEEGEQEEEEEEQEKSKPAAKPQDFIPPTCLGDDFFSVLGPQRPDHRWLIIGPARSGSTFHKDPNGTSAWNAVLTGSKYWIMFPSSSGSGGSGGGGCSASDPRRPPPPPPPPPPGVFASADQSEVTTPASIAEWLLSFHREARRMPGCVEAVCRAGEVLHVPSGWWHLVVNLEPSIALTQNFVPHAHLHNVLAFLRDQSAAVSGFGAHVGDPFALFVERLEERYPAALRQAQERMQRGRRRKKKKKRGWQDLVHDSDDAETGRTAFSFGFGGDIGSDDEIP